MGLGGLVRGIGRVARGKFKEGFGDLKQSVGDAGDLARRAAPLAAFIPGVGAIAAPVLGAVGGLAGQLNDKDGFHGVLGDVLRGGLAGAAGSAGAHVLGGGAIPGLGRVGSLSRFLPGGGGGAASTLGSAAGGLLRGAGKVAGGAFDFLKDNPELAMAGVGMFQNARAASAANATRNQGMSIATGQYNDTAPLRAALIERLSSMPSLDPGAFTSSGGAYG